MAALPVEWVLVIHYGSSAHRAAYGRSVGNPKYSKDYIQLSKKAEFIDALKSLFPTTLSETGTVPLTYKWPTGETPGALVLRSSDRPHLKWETRLGAPRAWKMSLAPSDATAETIPGNPDHLKFEDAENELALLASRGAGQPYLLAIKLRDDPGALQLRAYLASASDDYAWADTRYLPEHVQELARQTSDRSALAWSIVHSGGTPPSTRVSDALLRLNDSDDFSSVIDTLDSDTARALSAYLRQPAYGLFFDPTQNHDAWSAPIAISEQLGASMGNIIDALDARFPPATPGDAVAEVSEVSPEEVNAFREKIARQDYEVPDTHSTVKTRGSAQKAFSDAVKANYEFRCAITGIESSDFLVASHIVPWSQDQSIRLDPTNGICLSLLVDRAFEKGHLLIEDDLTVRVNRDKIGTDQTLQRQLEVYDGQKLRAPGVGAPKVEYLRRRRALVSGGNLP